MLLQVAAYVNATKEIGLRFVRGSGLKLPVYAVYADAYCSAASNDRRSVSGGAVLISDDTAIGWKSSTQKFVTTATFEPENVALCNASNERFWCSFSLSTLT